MDTHSKLVRVLLVLAIVALAMFIAERLWMLGAALGNTVSMIAVSWLLGLIVKPSVGYLRGGLVPQFVVRRIERRFGEAAARRAAALRLPFGLAVAIVYLLLLVGIVGGLSYATASILPQAIDLVQRLPEISADLPQILMNAWQTTAPRIGFDPNALAVNDVISPQDLSTRAAQAAGWLATQAVNLAALTAGALGQIFIILVLSLYVVVEDEFIDAQIFALLPKRWHAAVRRMTATIDRSFKSYLRAQIVSALLHGASAAIVFVAFGLNFGVVVALLFAVLSVVPLVGIPAAILIAGVVTLITAPQAVIPVVIILLVVDQIIGYGVVPKLMTGSTGLPSLLAMLSLFIGVQLLGFWGLVFSVPIVGSIYKILFDYMAEERGEGEGERGEERGKRGEE
jgi:predicted PurR-regulated permease PerM